MPLISHCRFPAPCRRAILSAMTSQQMNDSAAGGSASRRCVLSRRGFLRSAAAAGAASAAPHLITGALAAKAAPGAAKTSPTNPFFAMDTGIKDGKHRTRESQARMVKELGYAGISYTPPHIPEMLKELDKHNLKMFAVYVGQSIDQAPNQKLKDVIKQLKGRETIIWVFVTSRKHKVSSPAGDEQSVKVLREIADLAAASNLRVALYPHAGCWVERVEDAVRVAKKVARKNLGVTFNLCHWLHVARDKADDKTMRSLLKSAMPHLFLVTINGADRGGKGWKQLIQTLDRGTFDVAALLKALKEMGYTHPIGLQHYGIRGDARENLKRSIDAWRKLAAGGAARKKGD